MVLLCRSSSAKGFLDPHAAEEHIKKHSYRWYCTVENCNARVSGFISETKLREHRRQHHLTIGETMDIPSTYDWSLQCLREAVKSVDIPHIQRFYATKRDHEVEKPIFASNIREDKAIWEDALIHMNDNMLQFLTGQTDFAFYSNAQNYILEKAAAMGNLEAVLRFTEEKFGRRASGHLV
jgi:hypothetical protein